MMQVIESIESLRKIIRVARNTGEEVGFVPTMGALHDGHLALVKQCIDENDVSVVSIFVNPTQFNNTSDLENYPRTKDADLKLLEAVGTNIVFTPAVSEMYPEPDNRTFNFGPLSMVLEGEHRPGHFDGVAQIVSKLFNAVDPHRAYFGEKDFQQLAIIREMVRMLRYDVKIIPCPIVREKDGLAMSSRNARLKSDARKSAPLIWKTLSLSSEMVGKTSIEDVKNHVISTINADPHLEVEYFEISGVKNLQPAMDWGKPGENIGCIAVFAGDIRLIDNIIYC